MLVKCFFNELKKESKIDYVVNLYFRINYLVFFYLYLFRVIV